MVEHEDFWCFTVLISIHLHVHDIISILDSKFIWIVIKHYCQVHCTNPTILMYLLVTVPRCYAALLQTIDKILRFSVLFCLTTFGSPQECSPDKVTVRRTIAVSYAKLIMLYTNGLEYIIANVQQRVPLYIAFQMLVNEIKLCQMHPSSAIAVYMLLFQFNWFYFTEQNGLQI